MRKRDGTPSLVLGTETAGSEGNTDMKKEIKEKDIEVFLRTAK